MGSITVRNLSDDVHRRVRFVAAERGISVEEAARQLLDEASRPAEKVGDVIVEYVQNLDAFLTEIQRSDDTAEPVDFT